MCSWANDPAGPMQANASFGECETVPIVSPIVAAITGTPLLNQVVPITNSPADLSNVVGVGGTVLYTDGEGRRTREYGWAFSGGGSTLFTTDPSYQRGTPGLSIPCITDPTKVCRGISDVSAQSGDVLTNGHSIISGGQATNGGGTSLSSPLWAGMWTRVQSARSTAKGNGAYFTQPGWDYVTGFGTPKVSGLICDIDHLGC